MCLFCCLCHLALYSFYKFSALINSLCVLRTTFPLFLSNQLISWSLWLQTKELSSLLHIKKKGLLSVTDKISEFRKDEARWSTRKHGPSQVKCLSRTVPPRGKDERSIEQPACDTTQFQINPTGQSLPAHTVFFCMQKQQWWKSSRSKRHLCTALKQTCRKQRGMENSDSLVPPACTDSDFPQASCMCRSGMLKQTTCGVNRFK